MKNRTSHFIISSWFPDAEAKLSEVLIEHFNLHAISIRDIIRDSVKAKGNEGLDVEVKKNLSVGELISTDTLTGLIEREIDRTERNILIRHYPRTLDQYVALKELLLEKDFNDTKFWYLKLTNPEAFRQRGLGDFSDSYSIIKSYINPSESVNEIKFAYPFSLSKEDLLEVVKSFKDG